MSTVRRVGLIGVGRMGKPMGTRWLEAGYSIAAFDAQPAAMQTLVAAGATAHESPASVAAVSDVVVVLVGYPPEVDDCMNRADGVLAGLQSDGIVIISSTTDPTQVQVLARAVRARGGDLLDAPIARAEQAAYAGNVLWFAAGAKATLDRAHDMMAVCGPDIHHVGDVGAGQVAKAVNNMLLWAAVISNREAFALAASFNVEEAPLRTALLDSSGASWAMAHWDLMENTPWAHKDMVLFTGMGDQAGLSLPLAGLLRERIKERWNERGINLPPPGAARR
jgi:3-hydroxyisobutyrate dehydrogenase-like beta-hydroxyacid dehydrogenase